MAAGSVFSRGVFGQSLPPTAASPTTVRTSSGPLRGESIEGVRIFRGVPFAEPPVGALRFRPPVKLKPSSEPRAAIHFAAASLQEAQGAVEGSEDCLYLNVWAPAEAKGAPVFVWIHGGGFTGGTSFSPEQDGRTFARAGVVCITVAYRLGVFGFLDMAPLLGASYAGSANHALRDLVLALDWVRENVAAFGGDPGRVTIGGESAGAKLTDTLLAIPAAASLFQQAISESGGGDRVSPPPVAARTAEGFGKTWSGRAGTGFGSLLTAPAASILEAQVEFLATWPVKYPLRPEIEPGFLPGLPPALIGAGSARGKRLLIGTNRDESALFVGPEPKQDPGPGELGNLSSAQFEPVLQRYSMVYPQMTPAARRIRALTAEEYWIPSIRVADAQASAGSETWMYRLDFAEASGRLRGFAYHSLDVGLVWDKPNMGIAQAEAEAALARQMHTAWVAFISGETPSAPGLPQWPRYDTTRRATMVFDVQSRIEDRPQEAERRLWDGLL